MSHRPHASPLWLVALLALSACGSAPSTEPVDPQRDTTTTESTDPPMPPTTSPPSPATVSDIESDATTSTAPATTTTPPNTTPTSTRQTGNFRSGIEVLSVTDGDTMRVLVDGQNEPLRLIGINAPESGECLSAVATRRLAELVGDDTVRLEMDVSDRDDFGRLLRYVYAGDVFVNRELVREGLALARRYEPDTAQADELEDAQSAAEGEGVGMWDPAACGPAGGDLEIGAIHPDAAGDDNHNLNDEWVEITNPSEGSVDLTGWSVKDESASHRYSFPSGFHLDGGAAVRIHTGCGQDSTEALYWCNQGSAVWNNSGDTVFLLDPNGNVVASRSY